MAQKEERVMSYTQYELFTFGGGQVRFAWVTYEGTRPGEWRAVSVQETLPTRGEAAS